VQGCGVITAAVIDSDWTAAVDRSINRVGHTVSRHLGRRSHPFRHQVVVHHEA
jgi:hypothetical protein